MYVYVISNESFPGWYKVGKTKDIKKRLSAMQVGAPTPYVVELLVELHDDKPVHNRLNVMRIKRTGEWFKMDLAEVRETVLRVKQDWAMWDPEPDSLPADAAAANDGDHGWHNPARSPKLANAK